MSQQKPKSQKQKDQEILTRNLKGFFRDIEEAKKFGFKTSSVVAKPKSQTQGDLKLAEGKNKSLKIKYTPTPDLFTKAKGKKEDWRPKGATRESFSLDYPGRAEREAARAAERAKLAEQRRIDSMQKKFSFMEGKPSRSVKSRGALGSALASMGAAGMADEGWAAGMASSGGGRGGYKPAVRKRTPYAVIEE